MKNVKEEDIEKLLSRFYKDAAIKKSKDDFIILKYKHGEFDRLIPNDIFFDIVHFLPNIKFRQKPFVMGVTYNIRTKIYEITVINPKIY